LAVCAELCDDISCLLGAGINLNVFDDWRQSLTGRDDDLVVWWIELVTKYLRKMGDLERQSGWSSGSNAGSDESLDMADTREM
jgi:hypothetical protein